MFELLVEQMASILGLYFSSASPLDDVYFELFGLPELPNMRLNNHNCPYEPLITKETDACLLTVVKANLLGVLTAVEEVMRIDLFPFLNFLD